MGRQPSAASTTPQAAQGQNGRALTQRIFGQHFSTTSVQHVANRSRPPHSSSGQRVCAKLVAPTATRSPKLSRPTFLELPRARSRRWYQGPKSSSHGSGSQLATRSRYTCSRSKTSFQARPSSPQEKLASTPEFHHAPRRSPRPTLCNGSPCEGDRAADNSPTNNGSTNTFGTSC